MLRLNEKQIKNKTEFIKQYFAAQNAADGSKMDANANVTQKNIATLEAELLKDCFVQINRSLVKDKISEIFDSNLAAEYERQIENHEIYVHDETSIKPYCTSISMYPFLLDGLTKLGGESKAPKHLESFCGSFVNLIFAISAQFAGAVATVEFLTYFDHFARIEFGDDYLKNTVKPLKTTYNMWFMLLTSQQQLEAIKVYFGTFLFSINTTLNQCLLILYSLTLLSHNGKALINCKASLCLGLTKSAKKQY